MKIESLRISNYKAFKQVMLKQLPNMAVFIGANGTGKSTLFDILAFLQEALKENIQFALLRRGGFGEVVSRGINGPIEIELTCELSIEGERRLVSYLLVMAWIEGKAGIQKESIAYKKSSGESLYEILKFEGGKGYTVTNEEEVVVYGNKMVQEDQSLDNSDVLALKGIGQFTKFKAANALRNFIENWHISDLKLSEIRFTQDSSTAEHLTTHGENLSFITQSLYTYHPNIFQQVIQKFSQYIPGMEEVEADKTLDGRIVLKFRDGSFKDPFMSQFVSNGTLKIFAYLMLLHDPTPHSLLCIEEPENLLYPSLVRMLAEEFRLYTQRGGQIFISTHSPELINALKPEEVYSLSKRNGYTQIQAVKDSIIIRKLYEEGDHLGYLWQQKYFEGIDPG